MSVHTGSFLQIVRVLCCALVWQTLALPLDAAEKEVDWAAQYLAGLRQRGWHDVALQYLDQAEEDPLASPEFLKRVEFEQALTRVALAKQSVSKRQRQELLDHACREFLSYAQENRNSPQEVEALSQAGNLFAQRALSSLNKADQLPPQAVNQRQALQEASRGLLEKASQALQDLRVSCATQLKAVPKAAALQKDPARRAMRSQLENRQAEAQFLLAKLKLNKARIYPPDSQPYSKTLQEAAKDFLRLYQNYEDKLIGFYGRLYEGRCYQQLGKSQEALKCFDDLVDRPISNPEFRRLVARAFRRRAEIHLAAGNFEDAIQECRQYLKESRNDELRKPEWLAVAYRLASAYEAQSQTPEVGKEAKRLRNEARKLLREIARHPGEFQQVARAALASPGGGDQKIVVKTFEDAFIAGKEALEQMNSSRLAAKLAAENNPGSVGNLQQQAKLHQSQALHYLETGMRLADEDTLLEKLLSARYYLCWLYWEEGRVHEAALIGDFLARRYPENQYARVAAKVALAAYERIYQEARGLNAEQAVYEAEQLTRIAQLIITRWPESDEAAVAMNLLLNVALRDNRIAEAETLLNRLPAANRGGAELSLGVSLWKRSLAPEGKASEEEILKLKKRAVELLSRGFESLRSQGAPSSAEVVGALYFAQALLAKGESQRAVEVLQHPQVGPLTLVRKKDATTRDPKIAVEVYKTALRAFVSVAPPQRDRAREIMQALEAAYGDSGNGGAQLTQIYLSLGVQLQRQISDLTTSGQVDKASAVAGAFEDLLERVTEQSGADKSWTIQNWIAQTNLQLGQGLRGQAAQAYFEQAEAVYRSLLAEAEEDPDFAPSKIAILAVKKRLGDTLQAQQKFADAFNQYTDILRTKPNMLELQQAAATTLQQWGRAEKDPKILENAIRGTLPQDNKKNLVWGWLRLASLADNAKRRSLQSADANSPQVKKYHDLFFSARLQVAQARFDAAQLATGSDREKQLGKARQSLTSMQRLYPELGGPHWKAAYLKLLKQIENTSS
ncbi:MAG: hypothetical protein MI725_10765 [Pirellulales bacterium]|nr:hypothetical protein [Pirellulales bacterium]